MVAPAGYPFGTAIRNFASRTMDPREPIAPLRVFYSCDCSVQHDRWINKLTVHCGVSGEGRSSGRSRWEFHADKTDHAMPERNTVSNTPRPSPSAQSLLRLNLFTIGSFNELHFGPRRISGCYRAVIMRAACRRRRDARGNRKLWMPFIVKRFSSPSYGFIFFFDRELLFSESFVERNRIETLDPVISYPTDNLCVDAFGFPENDREYLTFCSEITLAIECKELIVLAI